MLKGRVVKPLPYLLPLLCLVPRAAHAQYFLGGGFDIANPTGEFRSYANFGGGFHADGGWVSSFLPLRAGARIGFLDYRVDMPDLPPNVRMTQMKPGADIDTGLSGSIWSGDLFLRLQPSRQFVEPYLEADFGGALFSHSVEYSHMLNDGRRETRYRADFLGGTYRFGLGLGIAFSFLRKHAQAGEVELGVRWLFGGDTRVAGPTSITHAWPPTHSRTDLLMFSLGGSFVSL